MNKNLKKVISAVAALAISASSVAAFAASYPDVAETATYKQAVNELSALNIISGFEDGTFRPDENVTRAQITKMIVTALGDTAVAAAEAAAGKDTQFADVTANHWAAGFVATGTSATASNFINGYSATQFGPEDNVTYAQAIKMLVAALGYSSYAENEGGWPNGYLKYGYSLGLTKGVSGIGNDDAATRAQVAQMIDNALKCPLCMADGYESDAWGRLVPKTVVKDGSGDLDGTKDGYQNLLNFAHDAYLVYGRVSGTYKGGLATEVGTVKFTVEKSDNWRGYNVPRIEDVEEIDAYKGNVADADDYLFAYTEAIIAEDENDEYTLISLTPYGATEQIELETDLYKAYKTGTNYDSLQVYKDASKNKYDTYKLDNEDFKVYVNGVLTDYTIDEVWDDVAGEVATGYAGGTITLVDTSDEGKSSTDGKYDYAMVTRYIHAVVDEVVLKTDEATIWFEDASESISKFVVDFEDEDLDYNLTLNGEAIEVADLLTNDVLTIAFNSDSLSDATSFDVMVSRDKVEAKLRSTDTDEGEYSFDNGETYKIASSGLNNIELVNGNSYVLYLNVFGKIAMTTDLASSKKFAILENVYGTNGDADYAVTVITTEGKTNYLIKDRAAADELTAVLMGDATATYTDKDLENAAPIWNRVIEYSVKTNGELNFKGQVLPEEYDKDTETATAFEKDYKASTSKIGSVKVSEAVTAIIDVQEYLEDGEAVTMSYADLMDGTTYTGYSFGETGTDNAAQLVLITAGTAGLNVNSNMAVFVSKSSVDTDDLGSTTAVSAFVSGTDEFTKGDPTELVLEDENAADSLSAGDAFFFKKNSEGYVTDIYPVLDQSINNKYGALWADALEANFDLVEADLVAGFEGDADGVPHFNRSKDVDDCTIVFGALVEATAGEVGIIANADDLTNVDITNPTSYDLAADVAVVSYDYSIGGSAKNRVEASSSAVVRASRFERDAEVDEDGEIIDFTNTILSGGETSNYGVTNLVLLKVVEDEVTEMVIYIPSSDDED